MNQLLNRFPLFVTLVPALLLAACSSPITGGPDSDPNATPLTLSEPAECTGVAGGCTLMMSDGQLTLAGTANVPVESMSYTVQGSTDQVISADSPVALRR